MIASRAWGECDMVNHRQIEQIDSSQRDAEEREGCWIRHGCFSESHLPVKSSGCRPARSHPVY